MLVPCCLVVVANFTGLGAFDSATCATRCGPTCFAYGNAQNTSTNEAIGCGICLSPVQRTNASACNGSESLGFEAGTLADKNQSTVPKTSTCTGKTCTVCNGASLDDVPSNAFVYITHDCKFFNAAELPSKVINISVGSKVHADSLTLFVQDNDVVRLTGDQPLHVHNSLTINGKGTVQTVIASTGAAFVVESKRVKRSGVTVEANLEVHGDSDCVLTYFSDRPAKDIAGSVTFRGYVAIANKTTSAVYLMAVANVIGTLTADSVKMQPGAAVLLLDVNGGTFALPANIPSISVSRMLGVFGKEYEVAYYNDGTLAERPAFTAANKVLLPSSLFLLFIWLVNPTFGNGDTYE